MSAEALHLELPDEEAGSGASLTPLIDVVFQLLVFFLLTTTFAAPALRLALPELNASAPPAATDGLRIDIDPQGAISVQGADGGEGWRELIRAAADEFSVALIRADRDAAYGRVSQVMQALGEVGIEQIHFVHAPPTNP